METQYYSHVKTQGRAWLLQKLIVVPTLVAAIVVGAAATADAASADSGNSGPVVVLTNFSRNVSNSEVTLDGNVTVTDPWSSAACMGQQWCQIHVQVVYKDGYRSDVASIPLSSSVVGTHTYSFHQEGVDYGELQGAIAQVYGNGYPLVDGPLAEIADDSIPSAAVTASIQSVYTDSDGMMHMQFNVQASRLFSPGQLCRSAWRCALNIEPRGVDGEYTIGTLKLDLSPTDMGKNLSLSFAAPMHSLASVEITVYTSNNPNLTLTTGKIPASSNVSGGHDLDASAELIAAALATSAVPCITAFPYGTHQAESSLNDQQLACQGAVSGGQTLLQFLKEFLKSASGSQITSLLANAGVAASAYAAANGGVKSSDERPTGCSTVLGGLLCAHPNGSQTWVPFTDAPPAQDPLWEWGQTHKQDPATVPGGTSSQPGDGDDSQASPLPPVAPLQTAPTAPQSPRAIVLRQCVVQAAQSGRDPGECDDANIFATGMYRDTASEATIHDAEVLAARPDLAELSYVTGAEKNETTSRSWIDKYRSASCPATPGYDCDEFPFYSTEQGAEEHVGADGLPATSVSLKNVLSTHNRSQGGYLSAFARQCNLASYPRGDQGRDFIVVPVPIMPTAWICADQ